MVLNDSDPVKITSMEKEVCKRKLVLPLNGQHQFSALVVIREVGYGDYDLSFSEHLRISS